MIFADKLIELRKKNGWSQEELAEQLGVSRQAVSKWEGAQSIPDLDKIIRLSNLFGVSTDYLLKDEVEEAEYMETEELGEVRIVSMEEANTFLEVKKRTAKGVAFGTFLCILSPLPLMLLAVLSESADLGLAENVAGGMGMIILLLLVAIAVAIFITAGSKTSRFEYLEQEVFETEYGVSGMVKVRKEQYQGTYIRKNILGTLLCILSLVPLFAGVILNESNDILIVCCLLLMLLMIGVGVYIFIENNVIWESFEKLLQEGDYTKAKKKQTILRELDPAYWIIATAIYLVWSFQSNHWEYTWIVWLLAAGLYPVVMMIVGKLFEKK